MQFLRPKRKAPEPVPGVDPALFTEREPSEALYSTPADIQTAITRFYALYTRPVALKLVALGYGPMGIKDPNFNPVFRRRFYLTLEAIQDELAYLDGHYDEILAEGNKERLDDFLLDVRWWLKNRKDIHEGSISSTDRRKGG